MRPFLLIFTGVATLALGVAGGVYLTGGQPALQQVLAGQVPSRPLHGAEAAQIRSENDAAPTGRVLFYRDPMGLPEISTEPKKDSTGMDYIPVYDGDGASNRNAAASTSGDKGKILYYRNPMGLPDVSYEPKKDSMGMDYIPVYENEAADQGSVVGISLDKVQKLGVGTREAARRKLTRVIRATGTIQPDESRQAMVTARFDGWVKRLHVDKTGDMVRRGQTMLELFSPSLRLAQQEYIMARRADPSLAAAAAQRLETLGLSSAQISALEDAKEPPGTVAVAAPDSGQVVEKMAVEGMRIMAGEPLYRLVDFSHVWVIAQIYEQDLAAVRPGLPVEVELDAFPGERFAGTVSFIYPGLTPETRTARVRIELDNPDGKLKADMFAAVLLSADMQAAEALVVPDSAVLDTGKKQAVLVERGEGRYEPREVKLGRRADGYAEILDGVNEGEKVVVSANFLIDAESNLQAALRAFTASDQTTDAGAAEPQP